MSDYDVPAELGELADIFDAFSETVERCREDPAALAYMLSVVRQVRGNVAFVEMELEAALARAMTSNMMVFDGVGVVERRRSKQRKNWDHAAIASWLAARVADRPFSQETGELLSTGELAQEVADEICGCAGLSYWKVTALKERDCDASKYCEETDGRTTVSIRPCGP